MNIAGKMHKVLIIFYEKAFEASLKKMTISFVFYIVLTSISGPKPLHTFGNIGLICFQQQMVMVIHEDIGVNLNLKPVRHFSQSVQERNTIILTTKDIPSFIPS